MSQTDLGVEPPMSEGNWEYFFVGDIGGTNARLELRDADSTVIKRLDVLTADHSNFESLVIHFFDGLKIQPDCVYGAVCFASKILQNRTVTNANYQWEATDGTLIKEKFGFKEMVLLNDFEACGYSVPRLNHSLLVPLTTHALPAFKGNFKIMLVGPGTGLGVCLLSQK